MGRLAIKSHSQLPFFFWVLQPGIDFSLCIYNWRVQRCWGGGAVLFVRDPATPSHASRGAEPGAVPSPAHPTGISWKG